MDETESLGSAALSDNKDRVREQFGAHADKYVTSQVHAHGESLARLVELVKPQREWRMLDVSTGGGHTALAFARHVHSVVATDLTPEMLFAAERFIRGQGVSNVEFGIADAEMLPFRDGAFELVTNRIALHHYADAYKAIKEMARVLAAGGILGFTDNIVPPHKQTAGYINRFEKVRDPSHNWCYPLVRLESYMTDAGLEVFYTEDSYKRLDFEEWADRMGCSAETKAHLRKILDDAPSEVRAFLDPREQDGRLSFQLAEGTIIARKA